MNTPPPCVGGQIGYGDTNNTESWSGSGGSASNRSRKYPPRGRRNASVSLTAERERATQRARIAAGNCAAARNNPAKFARSGDSPITVLTIASAHDAMKCADIFGPSWIFFQQNRTKFFLRIR